MTVASSVFMFFSPYYGIRLIPLTRRYLREPGHTCNAQYFETNVTGRPSKSSDIALRYARLWRINAMRNLCPGLRPCRRRVRDKFAETATANLSLQRSMSPEAAVAADDVAPFFVIERDPSCGNECLARVVVFSVIPHRRIPCRQPLARLRKRK